jgi:hypothetical protein
MPVAYVYVLGQGAFVYMFWGQSAYVFMILGAKVPMYLWYWGQSAYVICLGWNAYVILGQRAYMLIIGRGAEIVK